MLTIQNAGDCTTPELDDPKLALAAEVLKTRGSIRLQAQGTSMLPTIWPGDVLAIESARCDAPKIGDIVLVVRTGRFFVHRLIGKRDLPIGSQAITRGDAMPQNDPPAAMPEVLGRVSVIHRGSWIVIPSRQVTRVRRMLAFVLSYCSPLRGISLRLQQFCRGYSFGAPDGLRTRDTSFRSSASETNEG